MILTSPIALQAVLAGAITSKQPEVHVDFIAWNLNGEPGRPQTQRSALNSATDVTILNAPNAPGISLEPVRVIIYNKDTASITVIVKTDDGTTEFIEVQQTVSTLHSLCWEKAKGWYIL